MEYSRGFHPKMLMSFAPALPLGMAGEGEVLEFRSRVLFDPGAPPEALDLCLPRGLKIGSIREIELNTSLTDSLQNLTGQQQFGSASALIGRFVTGPVAEDGTLLSGRVVAARFEADGRAFLQLESGEELELSNVVSVTDAGQGADGLVGALVRGLDTRDPSDVRAVEGVVTSAQTEDGELVLELDTGESIRLRDVASVERVDNVIDPITKPLEALKELLPWG